MRHRYSSIGVFIVAVGITCQVVADEPVAKSSSLSASASATDWVRTGQSIYGWKWLADRYDKNGDGTVTRAEAPILEDSYNRLDHSWDDQLTALDFDWSKDGMLCRQKETTFALFKSVDKNSDGQVSSEEWQAVFNKIARDKGNLNEEQLEQLIYLPRVQKTAKEEKLRTGRSEFSPERMERQRKNPKPGELAPDFELRSPDGTQAIRLSSFRGKKPVVLIFGCFSCGNYRTYSATMEELYKRWKGDVEFLRVYVREAHPVAEDQAATSTNALAGILLKQPTTYDERCEIATRFTTEMQIHSPLVVDGIDNAVGQTYGGWPDRLYIVDKSGRIAFAGGPGPFGFNPREMEQSLVMLLLDQAMSASAAK